MSCLKYWEYQLRNNATQNFVRSMFANSRCNAILIINMKYCYQRHLRETQFTTACQQVDENVSVNIVLLLAQQNNIWNFSGCLLDQAERNTKLLPDLKTIWINAKMQNIVHCKFIVIVTNLCFNLFRQHNELHCQVNLNFNNYCKLIVP